MLFEKAKQYAEDVTGGREPTTFEVKKQCEWFLKDLERQKEDDFTYYFDLKELKIIENVLKLLNFATGLHVVGKSVYDGLENFQAFFIANIFGWRFKADKGKYRYRDVTLFIPRKNAKVLAF